MRGGTILISTELRGDNCDLTSRILRVAISLIFLKVHWISVQKYIKLVDTSQHVELKSAVISV